MKKDKYIDMYCRGRGLEIGGADNHIEGLDSIKADNKDEYVGRKYEIDALLDGTNLESVADDSLDYVVSVHVLEHISNPLKALVEWHRVVRPGGYVFTAVPQKKYTFDRYRSTTTIRHLLDDYHHDVPPGDTTHLEEFGQYSAPLIYCQNGDTDYSRSVALGLIRSHRGKRLLPLTEKQQRLADRIDQDTQFQRKTADDGVAVDIHHHVWSSRFDVRLMTDALGMDLEMTADGYLGNSILFVTRVGNGGEGFQTNLQALKEGVFPDWVDEKSRMQESHRPPYKIDAYFYSLRLERLKSTFAEKGAAAALEEIGAFVRRRARPL
ncbi:methyltransferase domain-containing protein [Pseudomonadota bacterium]